MSCTRSSVLLGLLLPMIRSFRARTKARSLEGSEQDQQRSDLDLDAFSDGRGLFNGPEHKKLGDNMEMSNGIKGSDLFTLPTHGHNLTYGDIIAACGDWYGIASLSISDVSDLEEQKQRFIQSNWNCLDKDTVNPNRVMNYSGSLTGGGFEAPDGCSGYIGLAWSNYDHFATFQKYSFSEQGGGGAPEAYSAGHAVACDTAAGGQTETSLRLALMQNACASHFLTDMYASGHLRQCRRMFQCTTSLNCLMSKMMHDEDNYYGLYVSNANGDRWKAYGDGCWDSPANSQNRKVALAAVTASAEAVLAAWKSGSTEACLADAGTRNLMVNMSEVQDLGTAERLGDHAPLLVPTTGSGCGYPWGACDALGEGNVTGKYARGDSCDMTYQGLDDYGYYKSEISLVKLTTVCPTEGRGSGQGFRSEC